MRQQAQLAIDTAQVILFVTDLRAGVTAQDREIAAMLQRSGKPVLLVVNKVVSYTHLDVYKRQLYTRPRPAQPAPSEYFPRCGCAHSRARAG